jgi:U3 small nucleolar RNA-associated protein 20
MLSLVHTHSARLKEKHSSANAQPSSLDEVYPFLCDSILSHSRALCLSTLRHLSYLLVKLLAGSGEVLKKCLQAEEVLLNVQSVRERILCIGQVSQVALFGRRPVLGVM